MEADHLNMVKDSVKSEDESTVDPKTVNKQVKSHLVKVTVEEINATRPSVYTYLLP
ncbi:hypothetical protein [Mucilaginibacter sp.]|uniref:hypothetical protein n=1 Tax=Mucilaginibacter sp. TaxID=1882438 RepID=UPI0025E4DF22|nr:hypothetical protein [Mucilaginibacter sp.]